MPARPKVSPSQETGIPCVCQQCGAPFLAWPYQVAKGQAKFCAVSCYHASRRVTPEQRRERKRLNARLHTETRDVWRAKHPEQVAAGKRAWQAANRERQRESGKRHRDNRRAAMIAAYGGRCACCGETEPAFLTLDHINGNGGAHRRAMGARSNDQIVRQLARENWPQGEYRLLCWNCQFGVQQPGGCPHQRLAS